MLVEFGGGKKKVPFKFVWGVIIRLNSLYCIHVRRASERAWQPVMTKLRVEIGGVVMPIKYRDVVFI